MGSLSVWHWLVVILVAILLFGSKRLPDAARGLGRSMRIFKSEIKEMQNDGKPAPEQPGQAAHLAPPQQLPPAPEAPQPRQQTPAGADGAADRPEARSA